MLFGLSFLFVLWHGLNLLVVNLELWIVVLQICVLGVFVGFDGLFCFGFDFVVFGWFGLWFFFGMVRLISDGFGLV